MGHYQRKCQIEKQLALKIQHLIEQNTSVTKQYGESVHEQKKNLYIIESL